MEISDWLSIAFGVLGLLFAIFFYIRSKREKSPYYSVYSLNIIRESLSNIENLEIKYLGQKIKTLTVSRVAFWNAGKEIINWGDIVEAVPLSIRVKNGYEILGKEIVATNESTNKFSLVETDDKAIINIKFDYIWKNNGFVALIYHTGNSSADIEICGKIKSVDKLNYIDIEALGKFIDYPAYIVISLIFLFFYLFPCFIGFEILKLLPFENFLGMSDSELLGILVLFSLMLAFFITSYIWMKKRAHIRGKVAKLTSKIPVGLASIYLAADDNKPWFILP